MRLQTPTSHRSRSALLPSLGAAAIIAGVAGANLWSMWHAAPELTPLSTLERLSALQQSQRLPETAEAANNRENSVYSDGTAAGASTLQPVHVNVGASPSAAPATAATRSVVVQAGETLGGALARLYIHGNAARDVIKAYGELRDPAKFQAGWRLWARFASAGLMDSSALQTLVIAPAFGEGLTVDRDADGETFSAREGGLPGTLLRQAVRCGIVGTLEASLRRCGEGPGLVDLVQGLLSERLSVPVELQPGDELRIVIDKLMDGDLLVRYHHIAAIEVRPGQGSAKTLALWYNNGRGDSGYYGSDGESIEPMFLRQPLHLGHQTSAFGMRLHPILHKMKAHMGVDFAAPRGTPIFAAAAGQLVSAGRAGAAGNMVRIRHADSYTTEYMHMQKFAGNLKAGDRVTKGQLIGYVGTTGRSTGPHLHFGAKQRGKYMDPQGLNASEPPVPFKDRKAFAEDAKALLLLLEAVGKPKAGDAS